MGIVFKQSLNNAIITYLGFGLGALNTLVLYLNFMDPKYFGLIQVVLSTSYVLMPILAFGVPNSLVKYYSSFTDKRTIDGFLTLMLLLPLIAMLPIGIITLLLNSTIGAFLARENPIVQDYVWHIYLIGIAMAYFEVFYGWARVQLKSVFGNFMKEIFTRVGQTMLLLLLYFDHITVEEFIWVLVAIYLFRTLIMKLYAYRLRAPRLNFSFPGNSREIILYSTLIILGGSTAIVLLEVDKVMINQFIQIENVAYFSVAGFIAMVIAVPSRSMHQITYPLTAKMLNENDQKGLKRLYQRTSVTLFVVAGLLFILILSNLDDLYRLLPEPYGKGYFIFIWLGLAKLFDAVMGNNNAILYNSDYYRSVLVMGVFLALFTVLFNLWLIPTFGLNGAAIASFSAFFLYNCTKLIFVKWRFGILPFTWDTAKIMALLMGVGYVFYIIQFSSHPFLNIVLKGFIMVLIYVWIVYRYKISDDIYDVLNKFFKKLKL
ncbi:lipopolysaccharide biosynthesis protein [Pareuzebyella sediminis]|uniref:lipopolysaccharide biosynthesis protein n=1 Tax=Pareuzebyella sediminis TaxID=2607998 RepID=UPI0011EC015B|nr:lipopolysaccharide biosynthesis protein [Pareuzebyella sediminis]